MILLNYPYILYYIPFILYLLLFGPIYTKTNVVIDLGFKSFPIQESSPEIWNIIKLFSFVFAFLSNLVFSVQFSSHFPKKDFKIPPIPNSKIDSENSIFHFLVGKDMQNKPIFLSEKSLYQNILITGTIGTGKTSSAMYPFTKQLLLSPQKLSMLILDVKGNYYKQVLEFAREANRFDDIIVLEVGGSYKYNPLNKPRLSASILANRLKTILLLFSEENGESYWLDKAENILCECIKLCRIYNNGYVNFEELHKLVTIPNYYLEKFPIFRELLKENKLSYEESYNLLTAIQFFQNEYSLLDERTISILKSEVTRITNAFLSDYRIRETFSPSKEDENLNNMLDVIQSGKILVLNMNLAEYQNLSKIIAAYLKMDFQTDVMLRLTNPSLIKPVVFISDEYHEYATVSDASFFAQSREAKCINIVATQSYTSLIHSLKSESAAKVILQSLTNKLWFRNDDFTTIESAQKQIGQEEKEKTSTSISENAKQTSFSRISNALISRDATISESFNTYMQKDFIFDTNFFTQKLENFSCVAFLSDGEKILPPSKLKMLPYFSKGL